ncbi:MAG: N-acetyltransferase [Acidipila sp.]|nr:N-acetyltransferase [Acidipila sp.]
MPERPGVYVHPSAIVDEPCEIGAGTKIWHFSHVMRGAQVGTHCNFGQNVFVAPGVKIGNHVKIQNNVSVYEGVTLGDYVFCGPSMVFTNVINPRGGIERKSEFQPTTVERGVTFGANCTIVCGHRIGEFAFIGAGAVVTRDVRAYALLVGNPARRIGWMCRCGTRLPAGAKRISCSVCRASYREKGGHLEALEPEAAFPPE